MKMTTPLSATVSWRYSTCRDFFFYIFLYSIKKRETGGRSLYWRKMLPTGTGEKEHPMLPMGRREKSPIDHRT